MPTPLLAVENLHVHFGDVQAVNGVSFTLARGEALAIIGETGSGKTSLARALVGLHPATSVTGRIRLESQELLPGDEVAWRTVRWRRVALAVQNAGSAFDPVYRMADQLIEPMETHLGWDRETSLARARELAGQAGLGERHLQAYPHQLSGGEKQRLMLVMALGCDPDLLVLDEPTSGQDTLSRAALIALLRSLRGASGPAMLVISHDLAAAAALSDRLAVLYAGRFVEAGPTRPLLRQPRHPYTWGLVNAYPNMTSTRDLSSIRGAQPDAARLPTGCRFHPRCTQAVDRCREEDPPLSPAGDRSVACHLGGLQRLLEASGLRKAFAMNGSGPIEAVRGVDLWVHEGEVLGLVGQTGSGKTTLGRLLAGMLAADAGTITFAGQALHHGDRGAPRLPPGRIQMIPQDPFESVDPLFTIAGIVREPLDIQKRGSAAEREQAVRAALDTVGLPTTGAFLARRGRELSGGQLQRVVLARALVQEPRLLIADEPVSMLDPSEAARVILLLRSIQNARGMGMVLISHDLALVRKVADRIAVMHAGAIIESGPAYEVIAQPGQSYTRDLLGAAPALHWFDHAGQ
jgi:peptide/nickel transport system ATP-binding protein